MIRFVHTADIHFGVENYGVIDSQTGIHSRLLDFERALTFCIDYALEQQVDFFLFAGDAYKTTNPTPTQQRLLLKCFLRLQKAGIPLIIVVGNHDNPLSFGKANTLDIFSDLPLEGFHVISKPRAFVLETKNGPVNIVGLPWPSRATLAASQHHMFKSVTQLTDYISQSTIHILDHLISTINQEYISILTAHLTVSSGIFSGSEKRAVYGNDPLFLPSQLAKPPFDYVGLGHLHRHQNLNENGYPPLVYSGSPEKIDFGERNDIKGFCDVIIEQKGKTSYKFIEIPTRPFIQFDIDLHEQENQTLHIMKTLEQHNLTGAIIKIVYYLQNGIHDSVDLQAVQKACQNALHLVGILPVHEIKKRERRNSLKIDMDLPTLLELYFQGKEEYSEQKDVLLEKALTMHERIMTEEINKELET